MIQVITIGPDGGISGLQRKQGQGLDLRQFGHAKIERVSLIQWSEGRQRWYIEILSESVKLGLAYDQYAGPKESQDVIARLLAEMAESLVVSTELWRVYVSKAVAPTNSDHMLGADESICFEEYDDAVRAEIKFLDALRLRGIC